MSNNLSECKIEETDEEGQEEVLVNQNWKSKLNRSAISFASTYAGQIVMKQCDRILWTAEKTTTWISNGKTGDKKTKQAALVRPLPWILFLPTLVALRYTRAVLSFILTILGYEAVDSQAVVSFLQQIRRNLRAIRYEGIRNKREKRKFSDGCMQRMLSALVTAGGLSGVTSCLFEIKSNKTTLNACTSSSQEKPNQSNIVSESDSDNIELKTLLLRSFTDETDSDDDDFEVNTSTEASSTDTSRTSSSQNSQDDLDEDKNVESKNELSDSSPKDSNETGIENEIPNPSENGSASDNLNGATNSSGPAKDDVKEPLHRENSPRPQVKDSHETKGHRNCKPPSDSSSNTKNRRNHSNSRNKNGRSNGPKNTQDGTQSAKIKDPKQHTNTNHRTNTPN